MLTIVFNTFVFLQVFNELNARLVNVGGMPLRMLHDG